MMMPNAASPALGPRDHSVETRQRIDTLTQEISTGRRADLGRAVDSDFSAVSRIAHDLRLYDATRGALSHATTILGATQAALSAVSDVSEDLAAQTGAGLDSNAPGSITTLAEAGMGALTDIASALSQSRGGRAVFANGAALDGPPIRLDILRAETSALAAGARDATELMAAFDAYFAPGGGVETAALAPFPSAAMAFPTGDGTSIGLPTSLSDPGLRATLRDAALVAALPQVGFTLDNTQRQTLSLALPARAASTAAERIAVQARIGAVEERVDRMSETLASDRLRHETRRNDLVAADPYETATRLQNEMTRLESIFAITARRASLRLTNFLR